jgi:toxin ParE1/3/4
VSKHRLSQRADRDLRDIYLYGVENFGLAQAERYRLELDGCFAMLSEFPRMGRRRTRSVQVCADTSTAAMS